MFQHADRYNPVESGTLVAIVMQGEIQTVFKTELVCGFPRMCKLAFRQGDTGYGQILWALRYRYGKPAPAASDTRTQCSGRRFNLAASRASLVS